MYEVRFDVFITVKDFHVVNYVISLKIGKCCVSVGASNIQGVIIVSDETQIYTSLDFLISVKRNS